MSHPAPNNRWRVPFDGTFRVKDAPTHHVWEDAEARLSAASVRLDKLQRKLYADNRSALLVIFQAMDAAGKDGTIRAVMRGVDPAGCHVTAFKAPSLEELDHDFLWRIARALPERGRIGVFNRSHYEEVLAVKVHPEFLERQRLPKVSLPKVKEELFEERYESIRHFEQHLHRNGTVVVKFWLNVGRDEQKHRFLKRIEDEDAHWKFQAADVSERARWKDYMAAYEVALNETSRRQAPWYAIPADDKPTMRAMVAEILVETLSEMDLRWPAPAPEDVAEMKRLKGILETD